MLLVALFLYFFITSSTVFAQDFLQYLYSDNIRTMIRIIIPGVRDEWLSIPNFFYFVIFPFVAAWAVVYGIMEEIQIFRRAKLSHKIVSFVMAAMLLPTGWLLVIVNYFYAFNAWVALMAFGVVFLLGTLMWGYGTFVGIRSDQWDQGRYKSLQRDVRNEIVDATNKIYKLQEEIRRGKNLGKNAAEITKLEEKIRDLKTRQRALQDTPIV